MYLKRLYAVNLLGDVCFCLIMSLAIEKAAAYLFVALSKYVANPWK